MRKSIGGDFYERSYSNFPSLVWIVMIVTHIDQDVWNGCFNRHQSSDIDRADWSGKQPPGTTVDVTDEITTKTMQWGVLNIKGMRLVSTSLSRFKV